MASCFSFAAYSGFFSSGGRIDKVEAKSRKEGAVADLHEHSFGAVCLHARLGVGLLDLRMRELHQHAPGTRICVAK